MAGAQDTIYLCNFRVSVDGEWLCLKELQDVEFSLHDSIQRSPSPPLALSGINHHHHHHNDHHRQQQLPEQRELRDIMPSSPPPLQHVSSLCLYSMFLHYSLHLTSFSTRLFFWNNGLLLHQSVSVKIHGHGRAQVFKLWLFYFLFFGCGCGFRLRYEIKFFSFGGNLFRLNYFFVINKMWNLIQIKFDNF